MEARLEVGAFLHFEKEPCNPHGTMYSAFAPGRVELLGNHTDYNEGVVLSAALDLGITVKGAPREDGKIVLGSEEMEGTIESHWDALAQTKTWADYPLGVAKMLEEAHKKIQGFDARFSSTLPTGAGLSSSAAIEVATGVFLKDLFGFEITPLDLAKACRRAENEFVGVNCGLLDQVSSIFGKANHAIFLDCRAETVDTIRFPDGVSLLIIHSGVRHALTGGEYNERREQCFEAAAKMGAKALRDVTSAQLEAADLPDLVKRRAAHVVGENERVFEALEFLKKGDAEGFGRLMKESHKSSRFNFENSTEELDALVEIASKQPGVFGARLTGGGFGGAIVSLVDSSKIDEAAHAITSEYHKTTGNDGKAYQCAIGNGALAAHP